MTYLQTISTLLHLLLHCQSEAFRNAEVRKRCVQVNFLVEVNDGEVKINPEKYSISIWADKKEIDRPEMTDGMRNLVQRSFEQFVKSKS
jgi:hypothetical protein